MATTKPNWERLREMRKRLGLTQGELAAEMGLHQQACHRRELPPTHREHVEITDGELLEWIGKGKQLVERRMDELTPAEVLGE